MANDAPTLIHPSAVIEPGAELGEGVRVGPFCLIGADVRLHDRVELKSHVVVAGQTEIGADSTVFPFACIGEVPQDLKFKGEKTGLVIGQRNRIREHVTMNTGTAGGGGMTRVGDDGLFMAGCHVAHDVVLGDRVIIVNNAALAGHCLIEDDVIIGGLSGVHQWVRIGRGAIIGAVTMVTNDVIPYGLVQAPRGELDGLNLVGLKRRGVARSDITALRAAFQMLAQGDGAFQDRARRLGEETDSEYVRQIVDFVTAGSDRSFLTPSLMLALIAGKGALPGVLVRALQAAGEPFMVCEMEGFVPDLPPDLPRLRFRIEGLGSLLGDLRARGVTRICMAGEVRRPQIDPALLDAATIPLIPRVMTAMAKGDDGTLRGIIAIFEETGFAVIGAQEIAPDILPPSGVLTALATGAEHEADAVRGEQVLAEMGAADLGQACVIRQGTVLAREGDAGTDAMLEGLVEERSAEGAILFKGPKPAQERRADLPTIGPNTALRASEAGLAGIVIEAGGVILLDPAQVIAILDAKGMFLWVRPAGGGA